MFPFCGLILTWKYISITFRRVCLISFFFCSSLSRFPTRPLWHYFLGWPPQGRGGSAEEVLLRKEGLTRSCCPALPSAPTHSLHRNSTFYLTRLVASPVRPSPYPSPHLPAPEPQPLWGKEGGCSPGIKPELEASSCELGSL